MKLIKKLGVAVAAGIASASSFAAIDTSSVTSATSDAAAAVAVVGAAVLTVYVGVKAFKWIRAAL